VTASPWLLLAAAYLAALTAWPCLAWHDRRQRARRAAARATQPRR
jgi:hypothetical protein